MSIKMIKSLQKHYLINKLIKETGDCMIMISNFKYGLQLQSKRPHRNILSFVLKIINVLLTSRIIDITIFLPCLNFRFKTVTFGPIS